MKITINQYAKSLYELTAGKSKHEVDGIVANFVEVLAKKRQLKLIPKIIERFSAIFNQENAVVEAEITTVRRLENYQVEQVESFLREKYQAKEIILNNRIDEKIKGGIVIKVGDEILDASIARRLQDLKINLVK